MIPQKSDLSQRCYAPMLDWYRKWEKEDEREKHQLRSILAIWRKFKQFLQYNNYVVIANLIWVFAL